MSNIAISHQRPILSEERRAKRGPYVDNYLDFGDADNFSAEFERFKAGIKYNSPRYAAFYFLASKFKNNYIDEFVADKYVQSAWNIDPEGFINGFGAFIKEAKITLPKDEEPIFVGRIAMVVMHSILKATYTAHKNGAVLDSKALLVVLEGFKDGADYYPGIDVGANMYLMLLYNSRSKILPAEDTLKVFRELGCMNMHMNNMKALMQFQKGRKW